MKIALFILSAVTIVLLYQAYKYYVSAEVLTAWMIENNYAPPGDADIERLSLWVVHKMFEKR